MSSVLTLTPSLSGGVAQQLNDRNPFFVTQDGFELPVVAYDEEYAESIYMEGGRRTRSREQNPSGKLTLNVAAGLSSASLRTALTQLQQTVQACRVYGGTLVFTPEGQAAVTYDLESISLSNFDAKEMQFKRSTIELSLITKPYGRLATQSIVTNATDNSPIQSVSLASIPGSAPALVSATITDLATQARDHLEVALDANWDGSAALLIDSASMSVTGLAGSATTRTGAYATNGVIRTTLAALPVGCCEIAGLTHRDRQLVKARVWAAGTGPVYARAAYRIGSGPWSRLSWKKVPNIGAFYEIELGRVKANQSAGTMTVRVEAYTATPGDTLDVDYLEIIPQYAYAKARSSLPTPIIPAYTGRDEFLQTSGNLTGKSPSLGSAWTLVTGSDSDDFAVDSATATAKRSVNGDVDNYTGRWVTIGSGAVAPIGLAVDYKMSAPPAGSNIFAGVAARVVDINNWVRAGVTRSSISNTVYLNPFVEKRVAGTVTSLYTVGQNPVDYTKFGQFIANTWYSIALTIDANGVWAFWLTTQGSAYRLIATGRDADLATGGTLASGRFGITETFSYAFSSGGTREFDNFSAWTPDAQRTVLASGAVILNDRSIARSDGTRPADFTGSYLKCPPAGRENRTHRLAVKMRRNDVDALPDDQIADNQRVDVSVTPRVVLL